VKTAVGRDGSLLGRRRRIIGRAVCPATAGAGGVTSTGPGCLCAPSASVTAPGQGTTAPGSEGGFVRLGSGTGLGLDAFPANDP
jgi:hypothetical protein